MAKKRDTHIPSGPFRTRSSHRREIPHASSVRSRRDGGTFSLSLGGNQAEYSKKKGGKTQKENAA